MTAAEPSLLRQPDQLIGVILFETAFSWVRKRLTSIATTRRWNAGR
mgnify:CR=1 FL=1